jgi:hypothetical protein
MIGRRLSARLERLEAHSLASFRTVSFVIDLVAPDGRVTESLVLEPGKPLRKIPASAAASRQDRPYPTDMSGYRFSSCRCRRYATRGRNCCGCCSEMRSTAGQFNVNYAEFAGPKRNRP